MGSPINPTNIDTLTIVAWNTGGTLKHDKLLLEHFLQKHNTDILLANETFLKPSDSFNIPNYLTYRNDRLHNKGGGTAIFIKRSLMHCELPCKTTIHTENTTIQLQTNNGALRLSAVYSPPGKHINPLDLDTLLDTHTPTLVMGDLNAKHKSWHSRRTNTKGTQLHTYINNTHNTLIDAPHEPTLYPRTGHNPDVIDIVILQNFQYTYNIYTKSELNSDHNPVFIELSLTATPLTINTKRRVDWKLFADHVENLLTDTIPSESIDDDVKTVTNHIDSAITLSTQLKPTKTNKQLTLPHHITNLISDKRRVRKRFQKYRRPADKTLLNYLTWQVQIELKEFRNRTWNNKLKELDVGGNPFWNLSKVLRNDKRAIRPLLTKGGTYVTRPKERAETFADSLEEIFSPNNLNPITYHTHELTAMINNHPHLTPLRPASKEEIIENIACLKNKKAPGPDNITNTIIKNLPDIALNALTNIFNRCLEEGHFPSNWKVASVIMLPKPGKNPLIPENYRPISLLNGIGKVFERIFITRLREETDKLGILPDFQHGFRRGHSAVHQLSRVTGFVRQALDTKRSTVGIFLDIEKAFDKVWHDHLITKLIRFNFSTNTVRLARSFLTNRSFSVRVENEHSSERSIRAGLPQGSVLSPLLFNIFTADVPIPPDHNTIIAQYADDTALLTKSFKPAHKLISHNIQHHIDTLTEYYHTNNIKINANKTQAILFTKKRRLLTPKIKINNTKIIFSKTNKYLGVYLDPQLKMNSHIGEKLAQARSVRARLWPMLGRESKLGLKNKLLLYKACIRPILTYACPLYSRLTKCRMKALEVFQNNTLRMITDAPYYIRNTQLHADLKINTLPAHIRRLNKKFRKGCMAHTNKTINTLTLDDQEVTPGNGE